MTNKADWTGTVGKSWAYEWQRTDRSFGPLTDRLVEAAGRTGFSRALDTGCGAGEVTLRLAEAHPAAQVIGIDISEELVGVAQERCAGIANAAVALADASTWRAGAGCEPDLLVSRHGVMFFDDPIAAFVNLREAAVPGAQLIFTCFREVKDNIWVRELASALPPSDGPLPDPEAPGPFAFGRTERVERILSGAGWQDIGFEPVDYPMMAGEGGDAVEDALSYFQRIGPAARSLAMLEGAAREDALVRLREVITRHRSGDRVALPSAAWIVTARAPG